MSVTNTLYAKTQVITPSTVLTNGAFTTTLATAVTGANYTLTFPTTDGNASEYLQTDGSGNLTWATSGAGDVTGPGSSTDNALARFDATTGKIIQNSGVIVDDTNNMTGVVNLTTDGKITVSGTTADGLVLEPYNTAAGNTSEIRFLELAASGTNYVGFKSADALAANVIWTLPTADATTANQALVSDASGVLSFADVLVGAGAVTDNAITRFDGTTGNLVQNSGVLIDDSNNITGVQNLTVTGDLTVNGTTTTINTTNTEITDNIFTLNFGEVGAGVGGGTGTSGFEIERGSVTPNVTLLFEETTDIWTIGDVGGTLGTDKFRIVEQADASVTSGAIPGYDANGRLAEASGLAAGEVTQLQNIGATTISATQWGYLGAMDQGVATTDSPTFAGLTLTSPLAVEVSAVLTADPNPVNTEVSRFDTSGGAIAPTLPSAATSQGKSFTFILETAGNDLTITRAGSDTIDDNSSTTIVLSVQFQRLTLMAVGTIWYIV